VFWGGCESYQTMTQSYIQSEFMVGIISQKNAPRKLEGIKEQLTQKEEKISWIYLLGQTGSEFEDGVNFLVENNCKYIIFYDENLAATSERISKMYPEVNFIFLDDKQNRINNLTFVKSSSEIGDILSRDLSEPN
jgi:basic membrane lipoprotein Med (substrate-binding protein (PBP1-ABC) superfamily)